MPYPNEHSARLLSPNLKHIRVTRTKGSGKGKVQGVKIPKSIYVIWFITKVNKKEVPRAQALRFPTKYWTAAEAKKWLKDKDVKYIRLELAKKSKEKSSMDKNKENIMSDSAPMNACVFDSPDMEIKFQEVETGNGTFEMVVYNGDILPGHFFWGNLAIDLTGVKFAKSPLPVLEEHFSSKRVGFTMEENISNTISVKGKFVENVGAKEIQLDMKAGFPMEASMYAKPSVIERVGEGESVQVNGMTLEGPGTVFRKAVIKEVSMCPMGAFSNTSSEAFKANDSEKIKFSIVNKKENKMAKEITIDTFSEDHPDVYQEILDKGKADGEKAERDLFSELENICADDLELLVQCYKEGKTSEEALKMRSEKLSQANKDLQVKVSELEKGVKASDKKEAEKEAVDPATVEFSDDAGKKPVKKAETEDELKQKFAADPKLQDEFKSEGAYLAYMKAEKAGRVRIYRK